MSKFIDRIDEMATLENEYAINGDSVGKDIVFGECKYSKQKKGMGVLNELIEYAKNNTNVFFRQL